MKRAATLLLLASACTLHSAHVDARSCTSNRQCSGGEICFLGECRGRSASLAVVVAEVRPPVDAQLTMLQRGGINLLQGVTQDFALQPPHAVAGSVRQELPDGGSEAAAASQVIFVAANPPLPDRVPSNTTRSDANGGFTTRLAPGGWSIAVTPPGPLPPAYDFPPVADQSGLDLLLPSQDKLLQVIGTVVFKADGPVAGARIAAVNAGGDPLSAPAVTDAAGKFTLLLPPGTTSYLLQVGPSGDTPAQGGDLPTFDAIVPDNPTNPTVVLVDVTPTVVVSGTISSGSPLPGVRVSAVNDDSKPWKMLRSAVTDANGAYALTLRSGNWIVDAIPAADAASPGIEERRVSISAPSFTVDLVCPDKARAVGMVVRPDGRPVGAGYTVNATRLPDALVTSRTATSTQTDVYGLYRLTGDRGLYRLEILPPPSTGLPRKIVQVELTGTGQSVGLPDIALAQPVEVVGRVHGAPSGGVDTFISGATVDFFALDAKGTSSILLGTSVTDVNGQFKAVLPDVPASAIAP